MNTCKNWFILILVSGLFSSCGFYSFTGTSIPPDIEHFSVQYFQNNASIVAPLLSQNFTEKLKNKFISDTRLQIVTSNGDFNFSGYIRDYRIEPVAIQGDATTNLNRLSITVHVKMECSKHPKLAFEQDFVSFMDFDATRNFSSIESTLIEEITEMLVQQIFNKAAINW